MKKIISVLLSVILCMGHIVLAEDNRIVVLDVHRYNALVGEEISYDLKAYSQNGAEDIEEYEILCDSEHIQVDENARTIMADAPGLYEITFRSGSDFEKTVMLAVNHIESEAVKGKAVFAEDFEGELPECLAAVSGAVIKEDADGNGYMYVDARGKVLNSPLFGGNLTDFVFEADVQMLGCDASSTSQISVGLRAQENLSAYRFANHEVVKYPGSGHTAGTGNVLKNAFSMSRSGSNVLLGTWYYDFVRDGFLDMYDSTTRGHKKPYHWEIGIVGEEITAKVSDIQTGQAVAEFVSATTDMDNSAAPLTSGAVSLSFHSMAVRYDNISIRPVVSVDAIELAVDKERITGKDGDNTVTYSVSISEDGINQPSDGMVTVTCEGGQVDAEEGTVTFTMPGEYYIVAECGSKTAVSKVTVSPEYELIENVDITIPEMVYADFTLPTPEGFEVIYASSHPDVVRIDGNTAVVTRPSGENPDAEVVLTALLFKGDAVAVKQYNVTVKKQMSEQEAIEHAIASIQIPAETTENITLPSEFPDGVTCEWETSDSTLISIAGHVVRGEIDKRVKLTAKFSSENSEKTVIYYVMVKGTTGRTSVTVIAQTEKLCYEVGEVVPVRIRIFDNLGEVTTVGAVSMESDSPQLIIDEDNRAVSSEVEGAYTFLVSVPAYGFEKVLSIAFQNKNIPAATDIQEVYSQNFESDDYDEAFKNDARITVADGKLKMTGRSNNYQTPPFGPRNSDGNLIPLYEYIFEADMKMLTCDAGSTGQMSVGVRYHEEDDASYRVAHHERMNYDAGEGGVNTQNAEAKAQMLSHAYGKSSAAASWYIPHISKSPSTMFSGRGYNQEYRWRVTVTKNALVTEISDIATGEILQKMATPLADLYIKKNGVKLGALGAGKTVLGAWSTDLTVDNIKISTISAFDALEIVPDKEVTDTINEEIGIRVYSVVGEEKTLLDMDEVSLSCSNPALTVTETGVIPTAEGEYIIKAEKEGKTALVKLVVSEDEAELLSELEKLVPDVNQDAVLADFALPDSEKVEVLWISSDEAVLKIDSATGVVSRPGIGEPDKKVILTAVATLGEKTALKNFTLNIAAKISDRSALEAVKTMLTVPTVVTENITLLSEAGDGVKISWSSSDTKVITAEGKVTLPKKDTRVTLTALISRNGVKETLKFNVTVKGKGSQGGDSQGGGGGGGSSYPDSGRKTPVIEAEFPANMPANSLFFSDLSGYEWAEKAILKLYEKGIVSGYGDGRFMPGNTVTREEFVSMIIRTMGIEAKAEACFVDVDKDSWFAGYVAAASHAGLVAGMPDGRFGVGENISRQDMAVIIAKAVGCSEQETECFYDHDAISEYARSSVYALKSASVIVGNDGYFYPRENLTRAEAAVVISRIAE